MSDFTFFGNIEESNRPTRSCYAPSKYRALRLIRRKAIYQNRMRHIEAEEERYYRLGTICKETNAPRHKSWQISLVPLPDGLSLSSRAQSYPATFRVCFPAPLWLTQPSSPPPIRSEEKTFYRMTSLIIYRKSISKVVQSNLPVLHLSIEDNLGIQPLMTESKTCWIMRAPSARWSRDYSKFSILKTSKENLGPKLAWPQDRLSLDDKGIQQACPDHVSGNWLQYWNESRACEYHKILKEKCVGLDDAVRTCVAKDPSLVLAGVSRISSTRDWRKFDRLVYH